jgi:DNA-binding transcriptional ArsR family regulator
MKQGQTEMQNKPQSMAIERPQAEEWAGWFAALGDPTRVLILHLLSVENRPMTVGEITDRLDVGQSTISHHLAKLTDVGFVIVERVATSSLWQVNQRCLECFPSAAEMVMGNVGTAFTDALTGTTNQTTDPTTNRTASQTAKGQLQ